MNMNVDPDFLRLLEGASLITSSVLYALPESPSIIQPPIIWQCEDQAPEFPRIRRYMDHWHRHIDAIVREVRLWEVRLVDMSEIRYYSHRLSIN